MAETNRFDPERPLGAGIGRLGREELIRLALALCSAAAESEGGAHGCIHPMNISLTPEGAALGPRPATRRAITARTSWSTWLPSCSGTVS